jgi:hypothetical protein
MKVCVSLHVHKPGSDTKSPELVKNVTKPVPLVPNMVNVPTVGTKPIYTKLNVSIHVQTDIGDIMPITLAELVTKPVYGALEDKMTNVLNVVTIDISLWNQLVTVSSTVQLTTMVTKLIENVNHVSMDVPTVCTNVMMILLIVMSSVSIVNIQNTKTTTTSVFMIVKKDTIKTIPQPEPVKVVLTHV